MSRYTAVRPRRSFALGRGGSLSPAAFSALGYFVLQPNPRGSYGQGEAFTQANARTSATATCATSWPASIPSLAKYPVDPHRVGLTGWSYGGFMTMFAVTQTHRFKAAVAGAGISDWLSYYGENSIDQWMIPYFGASVYDDPAVYAKSSAITYIKQAHTPTLVGGRRPRRGVPRPAVLRVLARAARPPRARATGGLSQRRPRLCRPGPPPRRAGAGSRLVCPLHAAQAAAVDHVKRLCFAPHPRPPAVYREGENRRHWQGPVWLLQARGGRPDTLFPWSL